MKNHSFPKTYTTLGAVNRAKKTYLERFPDKDFVVVKQDGKYLLEAIDMLVVPSTTEAQVVETESHNIA